jgi:DNA (cytosine-5)-methyltransferase 1
VTGLLIDNFAGGGGASTGIEAALGRSVDYAINHNAEALAMHAANHPGTIHLHTDVFDVDPRELCAGRAVDLAWFSPDCTHFSKAKGAKPVSRKRRGLAGVALRWAAAVAPRVIVVENVEEFQTWGPLGKDSRPNPDKRGQHFRRWVNRLHRHGYQVEWRELVAADYGAPTTRKRLFIIARNDGQPIVWPEPTHSKRASAGDLFGGAQRWRAAAECIDWTIPCPSIFDRKKPLAEATLRRIAAGLRRFVFECSEPFLVRCAHGEPRRGHGSHGLLDPLPTLTGSGDFALAVPHVTKFRQGAIGSDLAEPMPTITAGSWHKRPAGAGHALGLVAPYMVPRYGERDGQAPRCSSVEAPMPAVVPTANGGSLVAPTLVGIDNQSGGVAAWSSEDPLRTIVGENRFALVSAFLAKFYGTSIGSLPSDPMPTITGGGNHIAEVRAFLVKYYGTAVGQPVTEPLDTIVSRDRFGLVTIHGQKFHLVDIGLRMLHPRELATAQGFPLTYILPGSKSNQVERIGNSVCPPVAEAIVRANCGFAMAAKAVA